MVHRMSSMSMPQKCSQSTEATHGTCTGGMPVSKDVGRLRRTRNKIQVSLRGTVQVCPLWWTTSHAASCWSQYRINRPKWSAMQSSNDYSVSSAFRKPYTPTKAPNLRTRSFLNYKTIFGFEKSRTTRDRPQENSLSERVHATMHNMLAVHSTVEQDNWATLLQCV